MQDILRSNISENIYNTKLTKKSQKEYCQSHFENIGLDGNIVDTLINANESHPSVVTILYWLLSNNFQTEFPFITYTKDDISIRFMRDHIIIFVDNIHMVIKFSEFKMKIMDEVYDYFKTL